MINFFEYLIMYFDTLLNDWQYMKVRLSPKGVKDWLKVFERAGFKHVYEVRAK